MLTFYFILGLIIKNDIAKIVNPCKLTAHVKQNLTLNLTVFNLLNYSVFKICSVSYGLWKKEIDGYRCFLQRKYSEA